MNTHPETEPTDLALQLPRDAYHQVIHTLLALSPPPVGDTPEDRIRRENAAIAQIACLLPANADEANLAAQVVAAQSQAAECIRLSRQDGMDSVFILKFTAQSASMMRHADGTRRLLIRVQAERQKREADTEALDKAALTEHSAISLMADALGRARPAPMKCTQPPALPALEPAPVARSGVSDAHDPPAYAAVASVSPRQRALDTAAA
jgi:hypothetical protein